jgi:YihY family inner membrane protein
VVGLRRLRDPLSLLERFLERPRIAYIRAVMDAYGGAPGGLLANGLAFTALFAAVPTTLLVLAIAGALACDEAFQERLVEELARILPPLREVLAGALDAVADGRVLSSIGGLAGLVWASSQFYRALDVAFSRIFHDVPQRHVAHRTLFGFLWVVLLVAIVVALIVLAFVTTLLETVTPAGLRVPPFIAAASSPFAMLLVAVFVVAIAYRVLPGRAPSWTAIRVPAVAVGLAFLGLTQAFTMLAPFLFRTSSVVGSLAAAFVALAWLSLVFQALLLGAAWVKIRSDRPGH